MGTCASCLIEIYILKKKKRSERVKKNIFVELWIIKISMEEVAEAHWSRPWDKPVSGPVGRWRRSQRQVVGLTCQLPFGRWPGLKNTPVAGCRIHDNKGETGADEHTCNRCTRPRDLGSGTHAQRDSSSKRKMKEGDMHAGIQKATSWWREREKGEPNSQKRALHWNSWRGRDTLSPRRLF